MLTTLARSLASWPSGRSGWLWKSAEVITTPSTESPRNSSRSLVGRPPFSYAYERWVSARSSRPGSIGTPNASSSGWVGGRTTSCHCSSITSGVVRSSRRRWRATAARRCRWAASAMPAARSVAGGGAVADHDRAGDAEQDGRARWQVRAVVRRADQRVRRLQALEQHVAGESVGHHDVGARRRGPRRCPRPGRRTGRRRAGRGRRARPASARRSRSPLPGSVPMESRPTRGAARPCTVAAYAAPSRACMARVCSSGSTEAPTSSSTSRPAAVGSTAASAGRRTPGQRPSPSAAAVTVAPVVPAETTASASPCGDGEHGRADAGLDPAGVGAGRRRRTCPGRPACAPGARSAGSRAAQNLVGGLDRADEQELKGRIGLAGAQSAVNHDGGSMVPAEEVDGDPRGARLRGSRPRRSAGCPGAGHRTFAVAQVRPAR